MALSKFSLIARFARHYPARLHPFEVQASITYKCTMKCSYCFCPSRQIEELPTQQWREVIKGVRALGCIRFKFQGGEPTLRADFAELAAEVQGAGMLAAVTSNGTLIPKRPALIEHIDELVLSLDSLDQKTNDRLRGSGSYQGVMDSLDLALAKNKQVFINMVVGRPTLHEVEPMLEFCEQRGIIMHAQPVIFGERLFDESARDLQLSQEESRDMHRQLAAYKKQGRAVLFSPETYLRVLEWEDYDQLNRMGDEPSNCFAGRYYVHVEPNGDVYPCNNQLSSFDPRNVVSDGLRQALSHARHHTCADCWHPYFTERKRLFSLNYQTLKTVLSR
ncbi:MAG: radical SAM protein [Proteobacteria bacterium]|nr:radical SAM protein [Pseudomonadota bacterium]MBU4576164.1 radical SAM protein [Pseudomonadota bacterium]MBU4597217.1 radical SAM protein [Pseudomonadota bacterium]